MNIEACVKLNDWDKFVAMILLTTPLFCECGNLSPLGLPLHEQIGTEQVQTGVICAECRDKHYSVVNICNKLFGAE